MKTTRLHKTSLSVGILLATSAMAGTAAAAVPKILGVQTDPKSPTFWIFGKNFDAAPRLSFSIADFGDISDQCKPLTFDPPQIIECKFPQFLLPDDYRLYVTVGNQAQGATSSAANKTRHMQITEVLTDPADPAQFYILGRHFDVVSPLKVWMAWFGDISDRCSPPNTRNPGNH